VFFQLLLLSDDRRSRVRLWKNIALNKIFPLRSLFEALLQAVCGALSFEFLGSRLESWSSLCVEEDMPVSEFFGLRSVLKVLLEGILADMARSDRRDGSFVNS